MIFHFWDTKHQIKDARVSLLRIIPDETDQIPKLFVDHFGNYRIEKGKLSSDYLDNHMKLRVSLPMNYIELPSVVSNSKEKQDHPTQKTVSLFEYLVKTYTNEGDIVLDNCSGSGTTGIACINTNRNYILIEKEQKYFNIINERIDKHKQQRVGEFSFENQS